MASHTVSEKAQLLFFHPTDFFKKIKSEKDWRISVKWGLAALGAFLVLSTIMWAILNALSISLPEWTGIVTGDISLLVVSFLMVSISFFFLLPYSRFAQWVIFKLGGKGTQDDTTKILFYSETVSLSGSWIPFINWIFGIWSFYIMYRGYRLLHSLSRGRAIGAVILPMLLILLLIFSMIAIIILGFIALALVFRLATG